MIDVPTKPRLWLVNLPILAALVFHGLAVDRIWSVLVVCVAVTGIVLFNVSISPSSRRWSIAVCVGLLAGLAIPAGNVAASNPLSPAVLSGLSGGLIGVAVLSVLVGQVTVAWVSAWLLVTISGHVEMSPRLATSLVSFIAASFIAAASLGGVFRAGRRSVLPLVLFAGLVAVTTSTIAVAAKQLDGVMLNTLEALFVTNPMSGTSGIGSEITLSSRSSVALSQRPVLDLNAMPGRLRTRVLDEFDGQRWTTSVESRSSTLSLADVPVRAQAGRQIEMVPLSDLGGMLPSPAGTWEFRGARVAVAGGWVLRGQPDAPELVLVGDRQERLPKEPNPGPNSTAVTDELKAGLAPLVDRLTSPGITSRAQAEQIERFFHQNFEYSLETNLSGPDHPLLILVNQRRPAYCVYFASAMAAMLRCRGIPARIVSGYAPVESNRITGRVTIRQRDAHAWVEAWIAEEGRFVAFDPTPSGSRAEVLGHARRRGWIGSLFDAVRSGLRRSWLLSRHDPAAALRRLVRSPLLWLLLIGLGVWFRRKWRSKKIASTRKVQTKSADPVLRQVYARYVRSLRSHGVEPRPSETDDELVARLAAAVDAKTIAAANEFLVRYRRARFRGDAVDERLLELAKFGLTKGN